jgi:4-amino-4-deoxy-L-arabinose transferase-like glycosyltransferase
VFPVSRFEAALREGALAVTLVFAGVVLLALVVRLVLADRIVTPWIMIDELIYSEMAKSFAESGDFVLRDSASTLNNVAYPVMIAPAWLAESIATAYGFARAINVVLMVLAAVPVYFWGKRLMSAGYALLAAVLVLLMPSLTYTGMLMTENAFFTAVVSACFAIALTLERPTLLRQALALIAIALACAVRPQGLVLLAVYVTALALKLAFDLRAPGGPRGLRYVRSELARLLPTAATLAVLGGGYVVMKALQGAGLETGLGAYGGVVKVEYDVSNAFDWVVDHFAEIGLSVAVIPVSALIVLFGLSVRGWASSSAERAFVAVAASGFVLMVVQVGIYASRFSFRIEERNMFSVAPLLFLALCLWLARGLPRPPFLTAVAALAPAALLFSLDLRSLLNIGILSDTFGLIPLLRLSSRLVGGAESAEALMLIGGFVGALAFALLPRRVASVALPAVVALFLLISSYSVFGSVRDHSRATLRLTSPSNPSWIDERIGPSSNATYIYGVLPDPFGEAQVMWQTEFWNRSVGTVYTLGPADPGLTARAATFDPLTGRILPQAFPGASTTIRYAIAPTTVDLAGNLLAQQGRLALYRIDPPMQLASHRGGIHPDTWMGADAALTHYATPSRRGWLHVRVSREGWGGPSPPGQVSIKIGPLVARGGQPAPGEPIFSRTWTVRSGNAKSFILPTPKAPYRLEVHVEPTFSPANYGVPDTRQLGAQVWIEPVS